MEFELGSETMDLLMSMMSILLVFAVGLLIIMLVSYILQGLALSKLAKVEGKSPILAWIPWANTYLLFELTDTSPIYLLGFLIPMIPTGESTILALILSVLQMAFAFLCVFKLAKLCVKYDISPVFAYLSILIPPVAWVAYCKLNKVAKQKLGIY